MTATNNVPTILANGIKPDSRGKAYVWDSRHTAEWFRDFQNDTDQPRTVLRVHLDGLNPISDPETEDMSEWSSTFEPGTRGGGWIIPHHIEPGRIHE